MSRQIVLFFFIACVRAPAQDGAAFAASVRTAMAPALERQRASIQKQAAQFQAPQNQPPQNQAAGAVSPGSADSGFFAVPFTDPAPAVFSPPPCDPLGAPEIEALVDRNSKKEGVAPDLIRAVIGQESANRPCAVSPKGAQGLMQLMPETAEQFGVADAFDPEQNVAAGTKLLKALLSKYAGDVSLALSAYNAGAGRVDRAGGVPAIAETVNYVSGIMTKLPKAPALATPISGSSGPP